MMITKCLFLKEQRSLISEESSEVRGLFEVKHKGKVGLLRYDASFYKRDADVTMYCDIPGVDADTFVNGEDEEGGDFFIDEEIWNHTPESTELTPDIQEQITRLTKYPINEAIDV